MEIQSLTIEGPKLIKLRRFSDDRGYFCERFNLRTFEAHGLPTHFVQDNLSVSQPGVIRGMHFQMEPAQGKLVGVLSGIVLDVIADIRADSPTFGRHIVLELSAENGDLVWIPPGFAHGFCVLGQQPATVLYKVDHYWNPKTEGAIRWDDPTLGIQWPVPAPILSAKDRQAPLFSDHFPRP